MQAATQPQVYTKDNLSRSVGSFDCRHLLGLGIMSSEHKRFVCSLSLEERSFSDLSTKHDEFSRLELARGTINVTDINNGLLKRVRYPLTINSLYRCRHLPVFPWLRRRLL
jgi:hypothetical protein